MEVVAVEYVHEALRRDGACQDESTPHVAVAVDEGAAEHPNRLVRFGTGLAEVGLDQP